MQEHGSDACSERSLLKGQANDHLLYMLAAWNHFCLCAMSLLGGKCNTNRREEEEESQKDSDHKEKQDIGG
jgi:hypothetical protein